MTISCSASSVTVENKICGKLQKENIEASLVLFIMEGACSECINVEFQNIRENHEHINSLTVVGAFSNKRSFNSCANSIVFDKPLQKVFMDIAEFEGIKTASHLFYLFYEDGSFSNVFSPQACARNLTTDYYGFIKNNVIQKQ
jgi:hypothetical protein